MTDTEVELRKSDGSEVFTCKAQSVEQTVSNGLVTDSLISVTTNAVLGGKLVLDALVYQIDVLIQGMDASDYPNSASYTDHSRGWMREMRRAALEWGPTHADGQDTLYYDGVSIDGVLTEFSPREDLQQRPGRTYDATIEWTHLTKALP